MKAKPAVRKAILSNANKDLIYALAEIITNVLQGNVKLTEAEKAKLRRSHKALRDIVDKRTGIKAKKQLLIQQGGILSALIAPAITLLASLIGQAI